MVKQKSAKCTVSMVQKPCQFLLRRSKVLELSREEWDIVKVVSLSLVQKQAQGFCSKIVSFLLKYTFQWHERDLDSLVSSSRHCEHHHWNKEKENLGVIRCQQPISKVLPSIASLSERYAVYDSQVSGTTGLGHTWLALWSFISNLDMQILRHWLFEVFCGAIFNWS